MTRVQRPAALRWNSGNNPDHPTTRTRRMVALALPLVALALALSGCLPPPPPPTALAIITAPDLFPAFDRNVVDYVARCGDGAPVTVSVEAPDGTLVSVDGQPFASGRFSATVTRTTGQAFAIVVLEPSLPASTHFVRCLPPDFPTWNFERTGDPAQEFSIVRPLAGFTANYPMIFDGNGVPVWWGPKEASVYSNLLPDANVVSLFDTGLQERTLTGDLVRSVPVPEGVTDIHDYVVLPNGHVVLVANTATDGVDLTAFGGPASTSVLDHTIEEIDPDTGDVVWSWKASEHIAATDMDPQWTTTVVTNGTAPYDVYHWNSIDDAGDAYVLSFRHLDAVYAIDKTSGDIVWKLGGTATPETLSVVDDPVFDGDSHFGGQHDARVHGDGTVSFFDNGSGLDRAPRVVRYAIDTAEMTATLVETVTDPAVTTSFCCGSARKVGPGDWVIGWGGTEQASQNLDGSRLAGFTFPERFVYRFLPIADGIVTRNSLRAAMDAQFPDAGATATPAPAS